MLRALALSALLLCPTLARAEPLRVLLLDYNAPIEHDVLQSHLCVERCTRSRGCPEHLIQAGVDAWSRDFVVYRPPYLGTASFIVDTYRGKKIDFLSFSGHHASGFSGDLGRGRFDTEALAETFAKTKGMEPFFTHPGLVMLQGCRTDVKSRFDGDPVEYVLHVIEETRVREDEFERLLAAVQQIGGVQEAYRPLFPNACIMGYRGVQTPGGLLEIYGQVNSWLRALAGVGRSTKFDLAGAYRSQGHARELVRQIDSECPGGWPCNLCARDPATYQPLADALVRFLRVQRLRIHERHRPLSGREGHDFETRFEGSSYYDNVRWSCEVSPPGTAPVWPDPVDESPFGRLFLQLLLLEPGGMQPAQRAQLRAELVHRLGTIDFAESDRAGVRDWLAEEMHWQRFQEFVHGPLLTLSTFRQRSFFAFLAAVDCGECLRPLLLDPSLPSLVRENAASQLRPAVGSDVYLLALADPEPRVRRATVEQLDLRLEARVFEKALRDEDGEVRGAAEARMERLFRWLVPMLR